MTTAKALATFVSFTVLVGVCAITKRTVHSLTALQKNTYLLQDASHALLVHIFPGVSLPIAMG